MSIPLVRNNTKDAINTSIIAIKKNLERINSLLGLVDSGEQDLSGLATKQELEDAVTEINNTIDEVETSLQPVDTVTSGVYNPVTSNAVYPIKDKMEKLYDDNQLELVRYLPFIRYHELPSQSTDDNVYFKEWVDWMYNHGYFNNSYDVFIGLANPNYNVMVWGFAYEDPYQWSLFYYIKPNNPMGKFGYKNGTWFVETVI